MSWEDTLKAKRSLQKVPLAGSPVRGTHGYGHSKSRGSKRQQERKEILDPELREIKEGDEDKIHKDYRSEWKRLNTGISNELSIFNLSQKLIRDGARFIERIHPLIQQLPLAAMAPAVGLEIRGTGIGPALKNSVLTISSMMLIWADKRDAKQNTKDLKPMITEIMDKLKTAGR